jgi:hypothetical protein
MFHIWVNDSKFILATCAYGGAICFRLDGLVMNPRLFARFSSLPLSILSVRLSPLTSSSSNGRLVLLVQVLLEMVNWSDPAEIAQDSGMRTEASDEPF